MEVVQRRLASYETNKVAAKATFLDPRFKRLGFGNSENANIAEKWITDEVNAIYLKKENQLQEERDLNLEGRVSNIDSSDTSDDLWSHFDQKAAEIKNHTSSSTMTAIMVKPYLQMPLLDRKKDPLNFWSTHQNTFPELNELASKYLCVPSTSVPSERVFSEAAQLTNLRRNRLSPKNLDIIIFLNSCQ